MSDITINYVFNADNKENLEYHCDWLAVDNQYLGNTSVCEFVNDDYGNTYAKSNLIPMLNFNLINSL